MKRFFISIVFVFLVVQSVFGDTKNQLDKTAGFEEYSRSTINQKIKETYEKYKVEYGNLDEIQTDLLKVEKLIKQFETISKSNQCTETKYVFRFLKVYYNFEKLNNIGDINSELTKIKDKLIQDINEKFPNVQIGYITNSNVIEIEGWPTTIAGKIGNYIYMATSSFAWTDDIDTLFY
jgi:hypothetical protein